jgi:hypothetical protein
LPDCFFSDQKFQFGHILKDLGMENAVIYPDHLKYFTTIGYNLWEIGNFLSFGIFFPAVE